MSSVTSYMAANTVPDVDARFMSDDLIEIENPYGQRKIDHQQTIKKKFRLRLSQRLHWTSILAFISYLFLLVAFASPYWLSSYKFTDSSFIRLGLWDFCFQDYRHPSYQYDVKFSGCHWIYSPVYRNIRDWLQPPWFIFVQIMTTLALCISTIGLMAVSVIFMHFLIQYQLIILCLSLLCHMFTSMLIFFALSAFYFRAFDKSWIMYPDFNHIDWAFFFAMVAMFGNAFASYLYFQEVKVLKEQMLKMKRLIVSTDHNTSASIDERTLANDRSIYGNGADVDSVDAVYANRSVNLYNGQQQAYNEQQLGRGNNRSLPKGQDQGLIYPHFTQV